MFSNHNSHQSFNDVRVSDEVLDIVADYFGSLEVSAKAPKPDTSTALLQGPGFPALPGMSRPSKITTKSSTDSVIKASGPSTPIFSPGASSDLSSANTSRSNISDASTKRNQDNHQNTKSPPSLTLKPKTPFATLPTLSAVSLHQPPPKPVAFNQYLNIIRPFKGTLTIGHSTHNGRNFTDCQTTKLLFHRHTINEKLSLRKHTLYNGDDSIDPVIAGSTSSIIHAKGALNNVRVDLTARPDMAYEFVTMYLENELYSRSFNFKLPGASRATRFVWKNSSDSAAVKGLDRKVFAFGMKLVNIDSRDVVMAYVRPGRWEKTKMRCGKMKGRAGFVGERYGADFESLALFSLLVMIDSKWAC